MYKRQAPAGAEYVHRAHPLVAALAEYIAERALAEDLPDLAARSGAVFTREVATRTTVFLLRLRSQISVRRKEDERVLLSEECLAVAAEGTAAPEIIGEEAVRRLMAAEPARNMDTAHRQRLVQSVIASLPERKDVFDDIARERAGDLLADHRRVRTASEAKGLRYDVTPCLPVDVIGVYVLMPAAEL